MADVKSIKDMPGVTWGSDHYKTHRGGGTPSGEEDAFGKGIKINSPGKGRGGHSRIGSPGKREPDQPRDGNGQFTYNSMIGKPLKDVSKKHGKSRGTSIPPMFNGGFNGDKIKSEDDLLEHASKWRGVWYDKGTEVAAFGAGSKGQTVIKIAPDNMFDIAKEWVINNYSDEIELKEVKGNTSLVTKKGLEGEEDTVLHDGRTTHKVFVYKGTDTPVDFGELSKKRGEFGRGTLKRQEKGKAKETGDYAKWESKSGRPTASEKQAKENARELSPLSPVHAKEDEEADTLGGKVNTKYLEEEKKLAEEKELAKQEKAKKKEIREATKGPSHETEEVAKKEFKDEEEKKSVDDNLQTIKSTNSIPDMVKAVEDIDSEMGGDILNGILDEFGVSSKEELVKKLEEEEIDQEDLYDAMRTRTVPGFPESSKRN